jgi:hypothetical protein
VIDLETHSNAFAASVSRPIRERKHSKGYDREVILYSDFFNSKDPQFGTTLPKMDFIRAETLVHESRHMLFQVSHVFCDDKEDPKNEECDKEFSDDWANASPFSISILVFKAFMSDVSDQEKNQLQRAINSHLRGNFLHVDDELMQKYYKRTHAN